MSLLPRQLAFVGVLFLLSVNSNTSSLHFLIFCQGLLVFFLLPLLHLDTFGSCFEPLDDVDLTLFAASLPSKFMVEPARAFSVARAFTNPASDSDHLIEELLHGNFVTPLTLSEC